MNALEHLQQATARLDASMKAVLALAEQHKAGSVDAAAVEAQATQLDAVAAAGEAFVAANTPAPETPAQ